MEEVFRTETTEEESVKKYNGDEAVCFKDMSEICPKESLPMGI